MDFHPTPSPDPTCIETYLSYSLGLLTSKSKGMNCSSLHEGYIYQLVKDHGRLLPNGKSIKISLDIAPCGTKCLYLDHLGINNISAILLRVECGHAGISFDNQTFNPFKTFFIDMGDMECDSQVVDMSLIVPENLWIKSLDTEVTTYINVIIVGT